jgi:hypothetical protein
LNSSHVRSIVLGQSLDMPKIFYWCKDSLHFT